MVSRKSPGQLKYGGLGKWLKTPLGWARANLIYDNLQGLPKYGSLLESMCLLVWRNRTDLHHAQIRATAQASIGGEEATKAFKDFTAILNRNNPKPEEKDIMRRRFEAITKIKAIKFSPINLGPEKGAKSLKKVRSKRNE